MRKVLLAALTSSFLACAPQYHTGPFYITRHAMTWSDTTAAAAFVYIDEKTQFQINALLIIGRREQVEQAACLHVASQLGSTFHVDSLVDAYVVRNSATRDQITFGCDRSQLPLHFHIVLDDDECRPSYADTGPAWSLYRAELVSCGIGIDSVVAWSARPLERR